MSGSTGRTTVGQLLTPAGQLTTLGDLPLNEALSPRWQVPHRQQ